MSDSEAKDLAAAPEMVDAQATDGGAGSAAADAEQDAEIEAMRARVAEMEEEARKLSEAAGAGGIGGGGAASSALAGGGAAAAAASGASGSPAVAGTGRPIISPEQIADQDSRSIHVAQVDYSVTEEELKLLFEACGPVNRTTIIKDKFSGQPKGFAYGRSRTLIDSLWRQDHSKRTAGQTDTHLSSLPLAHNRLFAAPALAAALDPVEFASASSIDNAMILNETEFKGRTLKVRACKHANRAAA